MTFSDLLQKFALFAFIATVFMGCLRAGVEFLGFWGREIWSKQYYKWNLMWLLGKVVYFCPKDLGASGFGKLWIQVFIKVICMMFGKEYILCQYDYYASNFDLSWAIWTHWLMKFSRVSLPSVVVLNPRVCSKLMCDYIYIYIHTHIYMHIVCNIN